MNKTVVNHNRRISNKCYLEKSIMMIPRIIHQIWIQGFDKAPVKLQTYSQECQRVNSDFQYIFWDEKSITKLLESFSKKFLDLYNNYHIFAQKADLARYVILYIYGGIYLDMDMVCRRNLEPFLKHKFFCTTDSFYYLSKRYLNGVIGCVPEHSVFRYIFDNILKRVHNSDNVTWSTGTGLLFDSVKEYLATEGHNDIDIVPSKYLHPCQTYDNELCPYTCTDCYVAHLNTGSWNSGIVNILLKNIKNIVYLAVILLLLLFGWFIFRKK